MRYVYDVKPSRFAQFAINVMGEEAGADDSETALTGIEALKRFYREMGAPATLSDLGADKAIRANLLKKRCVFPVSSAVSRSFTLRISQRFTT